MSKLIVDDMCIEFDSAKLIPKEKAIELCRDRKTYYGSIEVNASMLSEFGKKILDTREGNND